MAGGKATETSSKIGPQPLETGLDGKKMEVETETQTQQQPAPNRLDGALAALLCRIDEAKSNVPLVPMTQSLRQETLEPLETHLLTQDEQEEKPRRKSRLIRDCVEAQNKLTELLKQVFLVQKGYGEKAEDALVRDAAFQWKLGRFTYNEVLHAFNEYTDRNADLPAPADIINIIDPPPEPLSAALYVTYRKRVAEGDYLLPSQREYCAAFEEQEKAKVRGGSSELREAQREIESYRARLEYSGDNY